VAGVSRFLKSRLVWGLVGVFGVLAVTRIAVRQLARDPRFVARPNEVSIAAPKWGGDEVIVPVRERLKAVGPINLFHPRFGRTIRSALEEVPGVRAVHSVQRHWPNRYSVEFSLHRPVAVVRIVEREIPVTWEGHVLPAGPYRRATKHLLRITGVAGDPARLGQVWRSARLADGLATLAQIGPYLQELNRLGLNRIDVARSDDPLQGVRIHGRDLVVRWGRPRAKVGENPVEQKIGYLREAARYVEQVRGREVDVRFDAIYVNKSDTNQ